MASTYGVYPESHDLIEDAEQRALTVRNPHYAVTHSLAQGGAITGVRCFHGSDRNLLLGACCGALTVAGGGTYSEGHDSSPAVEVRREGDDLILVFEGLLRDPEGRDCGISYRHIYRHRWGHVRMDRRLHFTGGHKISRVCLQQWAVQPQLTHYGIRPGATAEASAWTAAFGVCQWGRFTPGAAFDCPYVTRVVPRYVCCADPGREGLEWFVGSELGQWEYQLTGASGYGSFQLGPQTRPLGISMSVCPLDVPRGGVVLEGDYDFRSYMGVPIISGRANRLFLHRSFNRKHWPTEDQIRSNAERGVCTMHFHHDGDTFRDGQFWRDGSYPPFGPEDMREYDRVIADCHRHGIRVATYFSNKELHPTVDAYKQHGAEWARLPDDTGEQLHNAYSGDEYGAQMCLRSGWAEFHKQYIDRVLSHHDLDGTYYDWNVALYCHNTRHVGGCEQVVREPGIGGWAFSPAGHWDMDELLDLMIWTRRRVGPDGLMIIHNTMVPMAATENYADYVVAMEWGYSRLATGAPDIAELPLEWSFMGHRSRGVIGYGCLEEDAPERVHRQMTLRALLTGVAPWPVADLDLEMFAGLKGHDLSRYRFADPARGLVAVEGGQTAGAIYHGPEEALVLVGNLASQPRVLRFRLDPALCEQSRAERYAVTSECGEALVEAAALTADGVEVSVAADSAAVVRIVPA
ncbi:MAG: hypothetical protein HPY69_11470 [Armatimonadetes bacterium]|nr:hypothetical protein [Armatimonadota bacterium]